MYERQTRETEKSRSGKYLAKSSRSKREKLTREVCVQRVSLFYGSVLLCRQSLYVRRPDVSWNFRSAKFWNLMGLTHLQRWWDFVWPLQIKKPIFFKSTYVKKIWNKFLLKVLMFRVWNKSNIVKLILKSINTSRRTKANFNKYQVLKRVMKKNYAYTLDARYRKKKKYIFHFTPI